MEHSYEGVNSKRRTSLLCLKDTWGFTRTDRDLRYERKHEYDLQISISHFPRNLALSRCLPFNKEPQGMKQRVRRNIATSKLGSAIRGETHHGQGESEGSFHIKEQQKCQQTGLGNLENQWSKTIFLARRNSFAQ